MLSVVIHCLFVSGLYILFNYNKQNTHRPRYDEVVWSGPATQNVVRVLVRNVLRGQAVLAVT